MNGSTLKHYTVIFRYVGNIRAERNDTFFYQLLCLLLVSRQCDNFKTNFLNISIRKPQQYHHCDILSRYKMFSYESLILYSDVLVCKIYKNYCTSTTAMTSVCISDDNRWAELQGKHGREVPKRRSAMAKWFSFKKLMGKAPLQFGADLYTFFSWCKKSL